MNKNSHTVAVTRTYSGVVVICFSHIGRPRRRGGATRGALADRLVFQRGIGDRRDATGGRGLSVRLKDVRRSREVVVGDTRWSQRLA